MCVVSIAISFMLHKTPITLRYAHINRTQKLTICSIILICAYNVNDV